MRSQPSLTSGRRLLALVVCMLLLGAASVGFDAVTTHAHGAPSVAPAAAR